MTSFPTRKIGTDQVSAIGYGAMGMAAFYGKIDSDEERVKFLTEVYNRGCTFWDTADVYKDSEEVIGRWFKETGKRKEIFLATKFGIASPHKRGVDGRPEYVPEACERSLKRLGVDQIDLYYLHRPDPTVPIEKSVAAMAELVKAGKVRYLGLSEVSAETLRRAHAVHPIAAVQVEFSPFTLDITDEKIGLLKAARELGVAIVAYSPLGRGLLTGQYKSPDDFEEGDFRRTVPRYSKENFPKILTLVDELKKIGAKYNATSGQVALAWLLAQGDDVLPIPGTKKIKYLEENLAAVKLKLSEEDVDAITRVAQASDVKEGGTRYPPGMAEMLFADTPAL
nr:aldehyde reductase [Boreostereum vibrans]